MAITIHHTRFAKGLVVLGMALLLAGAPTTTAQQSAPIPVGPRLNLPGAAPGANRTAAADPDRVRTLLAGFHGFSRESLDSAGTDVSEVLRTLIADGTEPMLIRRQAIKALGLYPNSANFLFIQQRVDQAPVVLQRLYLGSLAGFVTSQGAQLEIMLASMLNHQDVTVRYAAVGLAAKMTVSPNLRTTLESRLNSEDEAGVRRTLRQLLARSP